MPLLSGTTLAQLLPDTGDCAVGPPQERRRLTQRLAPCSGGAVSARDLAQRVLRTALWGLQGEALLACRVVLVKQILRCLSFPSLGDHGTWCKPTPPSPGIPGAQKAGA